MKAEQEKISAKVRAVSMHLNGGKLQLPAEEESCYVVLVAESGCTLQYAEQTMLLNPGSALLLGPGGGCIQQTAVRNRSWWAAVSRSVPCTSCAPRPSGIFPGCLSRSSLLCCTVPCSGTAACAPCWS